jgi:prevent-host-death family protein
VRTTGIAELKASLSEHLAAVKAGEEVLVTEHGRPIARIVPLARGAATPPPTEELVRTGVLRPPDAPLGDEFWSLPRPADPGGRTLAEFALEREDDR